MAWHSSVRSTAQQLPPCTVAPPSGRLLDGGHHGRGVEPPRTATGAVRPVVVSGLVYDAVVEPPRTATGAVRLIVSGLTSLNTVSSCGAGTFSFDMNSGAWKKAGNWALPFRGRAEYVPEHNLWFGLFARDDQLCTSDLNAVSAVSSPVPHMLWKGHVRPKDWKPRSTHLLPLGSSKLCIARFFLTSDDDKEEDMSHYKPDTTNNFGVLTGVEVVSDEGGLQIIHHKSNRFDFGHSIASPL